MTSQFKSSSLTVLAFGLCASTMIVPNVAHAEPTVEFLSPQQRETVAANTQYEIKVKVTGPTGNGDTLWLQFPMSPDKKKVSRMIVLDEGRTEQVETFTAGPNDPNITYRACASVHFGRQQSKVVCIEWYVK